MAAAALLLAMFLTGMVRRRALRRGVLDVPNSRSSHTTPTPRGGGVAIAIATGAGFVALHLLGAQSLDFLIALLGGGAAIAVIGAIDDRQHVAAWIRLTVHLAAAWWALHWLGGPPALRIGDHMVAMGVAGYVFASVAIVWTVNLFNFMDGIDGIAASEAVFVAWGGAALALVGGAPGAVAAASLVLGAACCGFLRWNWPPARIFMGDVGSGFLGFTVAVLALAAAHEQAAAGFAWLILGAVFFVDATVTLVRRLRRGARPHQAHRTHGYQWLARRWRSHRKVTVAVLAFDLLWLLPLATLATLFPRAALWFLLLALVPTVVVVVTAGAGRPENAAAD
ncbi:MAG TPA: glycosyltransferase family 4 protein [Steroidobacteraceae bacterium]|nr:glycosyltransferase family 4 protein [Steroidobacteraceae bacterium]